MRLFRSTHQQGAISVLLLVQKANQSGGAIPAVVVRVTVLPLSKGGKTRHVVCAHYIKNLVDTPEFTDHINSGKEGRPTEKSVGVAECGRPEAMV